MKRPSVGVAMAIGGFVAAVAPAVALACPACAAGNNGGLAMSVVLGVFITLPFAITGAVYWVVRREAP